MIATVKVADIPKGAAVEVGGYDVYREGGTVYAYPIFAGAKDVPANLQIETVALPEEVFLVLVPNCGEDDYPVGICYSEAEALRVASMHNPGGRVRSIRVLDAHDIEWQRATPGPIPKQVTRAKESSARRRHLASRFRSEHSVSQTRKKGAK